MRPEKPFTNQNASRVDCESGEWWWLGVINSLLVAFHYQIIFSHLRHQSKFPLIRRDREILSLIGSFVRHTTLALSCSLGLNVYDVADEDLGGAASVLEL